MRQDVLINQNDFDPVRELSLLLSGMPQQGSRLTVEINQQTGQVNIQEKDDFSVGLIGLEGSVELDGQCIPLKSFSLQSIRTTHIANLQVHELDWQLKQPAIGWCWIVIQQEQAISLMARLENQGSQPIKIGRWNIIQVVPERGNLALGNDCNVIRHYRWSTWNMGVEMLTDAKRQYTSENVLHLYSPTAGRVLFCGSLTLSRMRVSHSIEFDAAQGITSYDASCTFGTYLLQPTQSFNSELLQICIHDDPYEVLEKWADKVRLIYQPKIAALPPVGWCGGSWASSRSKENSKWESYALEIRGTGKI